MGHPFGMTGSRIMCTLLNGLEDTDNTIGLESMCVGGDQGMAMIVECLNRQQDPPPLGGGAATATASTAGRPIQASYSISRPLRVQS